MFANRVALLNDFPRTTYEDWLAAAERELRGRSLAEFRWQPDDGIELPPLFTQRDLDGLPHLAPGLADLFTPATPWRIRQCIQASTPAMAARLCEQAIAGGADELLIRLDHLSRLGVDPGVLDAPDINVDPIALEPGEGGCAIYHAAALEQVLAGVDLSRTRVAFDAGASSLAVHDMLRSFARDDEAGADGLHIELGLDPIGELVTGPTLAASMAEMPDMLESLCSQNATPLAVHSAGYHHAGATAVQELACTIATAIEYLRVVADRAPGWIDDAGRTICLRMTVNTDIYVETAKLRAARLLWAKITHAFGASHLRATLHAESSERSWSSDDVHMNLLRSNLQAFIAALGGCDSIMIAPYDTTHDERDEQAQSLARNQMILLREEAMMQRVQDPCRGSFAIETLTDRLARDAWCLVQEIEARGGMAAALRDGFVQTCIAAAGARRREAIQTGTRTLVGTSRFADPRFRKSQPTHPDSEAIWAAHRAYLAQRDASDDRAPRSTADRGATIGDLTRETRKRGWQELEHAFHSLAPETEGFETLRRMVLDEGIAVQPILVGPSKLARARQEFARDRFTAGGFEVLDPITPAETMAAIAATTRIIVLCGADAEVDDFARTLTGDHPLCVAGPPRAELAAAFLYRDGDVLHVLRELYLAATADSDSDSEANE